MNKAILKLNKKYESIGVNTHLPYNIQFKLALKVLGDILDERIQTYGKYKENIEKKYKKDIKNLAQKFHTDIKNMKQTFRKEMEKIKNE